MWHLYCTGTPLHADNETIIEDLICLDNAEPVAR